MGTLTNVVATDIHMEAQRKLNTKMMRMLITTDTVMVTLTAMEMI
jgi:hypothetical protein